MVRSQTRSPQKYNNQTQKTWNASQKSGNTQQKFKARRTKYNPNVSCTPCMRTQQVREDYYRLIGFSEDFQFTKSNMYQGAGKANVVLGAKEDDCTNNPPSEGSVDNHN